MTRVGSLMGTPGYMSPEQLAGAEVDERSDQFPYGVRLRHPSVAVSLANLGSIELALGRTSEALAAYLAHLDNAASHP